MGILIPIHDAVSPSLSAAMDRQRAAFELKFTLDNGRVAEIEQWARQNLSLDPHGDLALGGAYRVSTVYLDTPAFDVFRRADSYRRRKYRLRRYGEEPRVFLERKTKTGDRVWKRRTGIAVDDLSRLQNGAADPAWPAAWFQRRVQRRNLAPALLVNYERLAFLGLSEGTSVRLTLDRQLGCAPSVGWSLNPTTPGRVLTSAAILELKYHGLLPILFRRLLQETGLNPGAMSKYRLGVSVWELAGRVPQ